MPAAQGQLEGAEVVPSVIAPGNYDGVHLGHRALIASAREHGLRHGLSPRALTFDPHPAALLDPARAPATLTLQPRRAELLRAVGAEAVIVQRFDHAFAALSPEAFLEALCARGAKALVVGPDFRFGKARAGDVSLLRELGRRFGFDVLVEEPVLLEGERVSSSAIREALRRGDVARAARMLGRVHEVEGEVVRGDARGRTLGFPTANLAIDPVLPPSDGVYAVVARRLAAAGRELMFGVANIGVRPTFAAGRSVEVHFLDWDRELYGERIRVGFVERIRGEARFANVDALRAQIEHDVARAREILRALDEELVSWI